MARDSSLTQELWPLADTLEDGLPQLALEKTYRNILVSP